MSSNRDLGVIIDHDLSPSTAERLSRLNLLTLELRRFHSDLTWCYKILFGCVDMHSDEFLPCDAMHSAAIAVTRCSSVCLSVRPSRS